MPKMRRFLAHVTVLVILLSTFTVTLTAQQKMDSVERARMKAMLKGIKGAVKNDYYDEGYHGIDIEARFKAAEEKLDAATSTGQGLGIIAQTLLDFDDSHLYFIPPATNLRVEYGWRMKMIGDKCLVTSVKPKSDAEAQGLKAGDEILSIEKFKPTRKQLWKILYYYKVLSKRQGLNVVAVSPGAAAPREMNISAKLTNLPLSINEDNFFRLTSDYRESRNDKHLIQKVGGTTIWRMPSFEFEPDQADSIIHDRILGSTGLILDLRGNGGGYVKTLERIAGYLFDKDLKIADLKGRKTMEPMHAKSQGKNAFTGKLVVLVDSDSGSAAEIFARLVQLEKRGQVIGDVSSGAVMQAKGFDGKSGNDYSMIFYGASITNADVIMSDGKSIEHVGVTPDEILIPTQADLAAGRDIVLSRAVELLGGNLPPEAAGAMLAYDWAGQ